MIQNSLSAGIVGALMTVGSLGVANATPVAPLATAALSSPYVKQVSFWGQPFPSGYALYRGQCYSYVAVESPAGYVWKRVYICNDHNGRTFGHGYGGRF